ncbi:MAG TPA: phospholipase A [Rhodocyclaceae bacterium]|nr:phospholipase A [Rhodocyclaceae bacterium]
MARKQWALLLALSGVVSMAQADGLKDCLGIQDDPVRLACYDKLARQSLPEKTVVILDKAPSAPPSLPVVIDNPLPPSPVSALSERWELDPQSKAGTFQFRAHNGTYILPVYGSSDVNQSPSSPSRGVASVPRQQPGEIKFQLSFKSKLAEDMLGSGTDLWFGYTQQSHWQFYNADESRPFRETNYEPELIWTIPTRYEIAGWRARMLNLGLLHQSNGRADPLSRSWNRLYGQFGLEQGNWVVMVRPWYRLPEGGNDDNPDIKRYLGQGDLTVMWKNAGHVVTLMGRRSLSDGGKGAVQADWAFPLSRQLKGHLQLFSGYGESLIDYNHNQTTVGIGVSLGEGL